MSERQLCFWLRDEKSSTQYLRDHWSSYNQSNRSIWCESSKKLDTIAQVKSQSGVRAVLVAERSYANRDWYPNDRPLGVMKFLKIKKVL